jgi:uncharacterized membrane protein SpoIIM required for sporulation
MISNAWIAKRKKHWDRLQALLTQTDSGGIASLGHKDLREMAFLYRQLAADLSVLRADPTARTRAEQLNGLLSRAHAMIYSTKRSNWRAVGRFFLRRYPALLRDCAPFILASLLLFVGGAGLGCLLTVVRPAFMRTMLGPAMVQTIEQQKMWTESVTSIAPQASSAITTNNLSVAFLMFAGGMVAGLGTLYMLGWNGLLIGVVATACAQHQMSLKLWSFVAPHGALELPALVIAGAAGLRLAYGILFPGYYSRGYSLRQASVAAVQLLLGVVPLLLCAGVLEGFLSPSQAPPLLKFLVSGIMLALLLTWLSLPTPATADEGAAAQSSARSFTSR